MEIIIISCVPTYNTSHRIMLIVQCGLIKVAQYGQKVILWLVWYVFTQVMIIMDDLIHINWETSKIMMMWHFSVLCLTTMFYYIWRKNFVDQRILQQNKMSSEQYFDCAIIVQRNLYWGEWCFCGEVTSALDWFSHQTWIQWHFWSGIISKVEIMTND